VSGFLFCSALICGESHIVVGATRQGLRLTLTQTVPKSLGAVGITHWSPDGVSFPSSRWHSICTKGSDA